MRTKIQFLNQERKKRNKTPIENRKGGKKRQQKQNSLL